MAIHSPIQEVSTATPERSSSNSTDRAVLRPLSSSSCSTCSVDTVKLPYLPDTPQPSSLPLYKASPHNTLSLFDILSLSMPELDDDEEATRRSVDHDLLGLEFVTDDGFDDNWDELSIDGQLFVFEIDDKLADGDEEYLSSSPQSVVIGTTEYTRAKAHDDDQDRLQRHMTLTSQKN